MSYDGADRPVSLTIHDGEPETSQPIVTGASYLASGPLSSLSLGNGLVEQRAYNPSYDPTSIRVPGHLHWTYTIDANGNITDIVDQLTPEQSRTYAYQDYQYYLTQGSGPWGDLSWTYDRLGNRLSELRDGVATDYLYRTNAAGNASLKLEATVVDTAEPQTTRYFFDAAGSLTHQRADSEQTEYEYDAAKRMSTLRHDAANRGPTVTQLRYDGRSFLDQSEKTWLPFPNEKWTTQPVYDSSGVLHSREIQRPRTAQQPRNAPSIQGHDDILYFAGRPVAQISVRKSQVPGGDEDVTRQVLFLTTDHLGTPVLATGTDGGVVWGGGFEPFGADYAEAEEAGVFLRFPGQWEDGSWEMDGAGPYYNVHRWYLAGLGRYSRVDPLGLEAGVNLVSYAFSEPIRNDDQLGLDPGCCSKNWEDCWSDCIRVRRLDFWQLIGFAALPKRLLPPFRVPYPKDPLTNIPRSLGHLLGGRTTIVGSALRNSGRVLSRIATPLTVFEGYYDIATIARCALDCNSDACQEFLPIDDLTTVAFSDIPFLFE